MKTSSKFKRMACVMMSALTLTTGLAIKGNEVNALGSKKDNPIAKAKRIVADCEEKDLELMIDAYKILEKSTTWAGVDSGDKETMKKFFDVALAWENRMGLELEYSGKVNPIEAIKALGDAMNGTQTAPRSPKFRDALATHLSETLSSSKDDLNTVIGKVDGQTFLVSPDSARGFKKFDKYCQIIYDNCRDKFTTALFNRFKKIEEENPSVAKQIFSNPLTIIGGIALIIKFGADGFNMLRGFASEAKHKAQTAYRKATAKGFDLNHYPELLDRIEKRLRTELVGQDEAITRVIEIMRGHFQSMVEAKAQGKEYEHGLLLYLVGSPATGKSTMMKIIQEEIGISCFSSKMSDIVACIVNNARNVADILTKAIKIPTTSGTTIEKDTPLVEQLKLGVPTFYLFDEIDKMRKYDAQLQDLTNNKNVINIISKEQENALDKNKNNNIYSIDEIIRNFIDTGYLAGQDAKGSIVCVTSNETDEDMNELESSLRNRYEPYRVNFKDLNKEDYIEIIRRGSVELQEYYTKTFDTTIDWDNNAINYFANKFVEESAGGRCTAPLMMKVRSALMLFRKNSDIDISGKRLSINIDKQNNIAIALA